MTRRCSHCSNNGHNSRTCPTRSTAASSSSTTGSSSSTGVKLFGVRLIDGSIIKKSASMGNLSAHYHSSSNSPNPDSPLSDHVRDSASLADGYLSDDPAHGSGSGNRRGERKKGVPWTEEEHRMFLIGLQKLGKGDWRGIARNYVVSRTPTQVASHAQKYFIRQSNATRRKRRSSLFDMVPDMATDPQTVPEEHELASLPERESFPEREVNDDADDLPSLNLSLKPEYEPMETTTEEPTKESADETVGRSSEFKPTIAGTSEFAVAPLVPASSEYTPMIPISSEFTPLVPGTSDYPQYVPGFFSAYMPFPYPYWRQNTISMEETKDAEVPHHEILKPVPILPKEPVNVDELVGITNLSIGETERSEREPSPLSLKLIGEPSRQSAFHANAPVSSSELSKGKTSPIQAV